MNIANIHNQLGELDQAILLYKQGIEIIEGLRGERI